MGSTHYILRTVILSLMMLMTSLAWSQGSQTVTINEGDSVRLKANSTHALAYLWFKNGEPILEHHEEILPVSEAGIYTVLALGNNCNSDLSDPVTVLVTTQGGETKLVDMFIRNEPDKPVAQLGEEITYSIITSNKNQTTAKQVIIKIKLAPEVRFQRFEGIHTGQATYHPKDHEISWILDSVAIDQYFNLDFKVVAERSGTAMQLAIVSSQNQEANPADNQSTSKVEVLAFKIPNVFTPNGDGINDTFEILGLEYLTKKILTVYNQHGHEVYRNVDYQNNWAGMGLAPAVYFYIFEVKFQHGGEQVFKGHVTVLR